MYNVLCSPSYHPALDSAASIYYFKRVFRPQAFPANVVHEYLTMYD